MINLFVFNSIFVKEEDFSLVVTGVSLLRFFTVRKWWIEKYYKQIFNFTSSIVERLCNLRGFCFCFENHKWKNVCEAWLIYKQKKNEMKCYISVVKPWYSNTLLQSNKKKKNISIPWVRQPNQSEKIPLLFHIHLAFETKAAIYFFSVVRKLCVLSSYQMLHEAKALCNQTKSKPKINEYSCDIIMCCVVTCVKNRKTIFKHLPLSHTASTFCVRDKRKIWCFHYK